MDGSDGEWDAPTASARSSRSPAIHLHPYFPDFQAWIDVLGRRARGRRVRRSRCEEPTRSMLAGRGHRRPRGWSPSLWARVVGVTWASTCSDDRRWRPRRRGRRCAALTIGVGDLGRRQRIERCAVDASGPLPRRSWRTARSSPTSTRRTRSPSSVYVSPQIEDLLGYTPEEWLNDPELWPRLLHPDDRARALAENVRHNETGRALPPGVPDVPWTDTWCGSTTRRGSSGRDGKPRYSHGVMLDISGRKHDRRAGAFRTYHDELTGLPSRAMFEELSSSRSRGHAGTRAPSRCSAST